LPYDLDALREIALVQLDRARLLPRLLRVLFVSLQNPQLVPMAEARYEVFDAIFRNPLNR